MTPKWKVIVLSGAFIPLGFLAGFSSWGIHKGVETMRARSHDFGYAVGPRGRIDYRRSIRFEGGEAVRVGAGMAALGACGLAWLAILCWPGPPGRLIIHHASARTAFALYLLAVLTLKPPWRLTSPPVFVFFIIHGLIFGLSLLVRAIRDGDRKKRLIAFFAFAAMMGIPFMTITAIGAWGADAGHDLGFAAGAAMVSVIAAGAQLTLLDRKRSWGL